MSLEADWGDPAVRWTAPTAGAYSFTVAIGGTTASGLGGFGNNFVQYAGVRINGIDQNDTAFASNIRVWNFTVSLSTGDTVDTFVLNPGFAAGGRWQYADRNIDLGSARTRQCHAAGAWPWRAGAARPSPRFGCQGRRLNRVC